MSEDDGMAPRLWNPASQPRVPLPPIHSDSAVKKTDRRVAHGIAGAIAHAHDFIGCAVNILRNASKSKGSKQYRDPSDIKAAVDTAYFERVARAGKIHWE